MQKKIAYITNIAPHYREKLWKLFAGESDLNFHFIFGKSATGIKEIDFSDNGWPAFQQRLHDSQNVRFKGVIVWQKGVLKQVWQKPWDAVIVLGDMNILSSWLATIILRWRNIPVIFWGHGVYGSERGIKRWIRKRFLRLANHHLLYWNHAKQNMQTFGIPTERMTVVYNSLDYDQHVRLRTEVINPSFYEHRGYFENNALPTLIFIGRLTPEKRLHLLIQALMDLKTDGWEANLMIIGGGAELPKLQSMAKDLKEKIHFYGPCYDEMEIGKLMANADLCVSPGNVGLTAIHSLSFGTPVCSHNDFGSQMPEVEAIREGITGIFFDAKKKNLAETIQNWFSKEIDRLKLRQQCYDLIDQHYNPYVQKKIFKDVLLNSKL